MAVGSATVCTQVSASREHRCEPFSWRDKAYICDVWRVEHYQTSEVIAEALSVPKNAKIWSDDSAACLATLEKRWGTVYSAAFAADGHLATDADDGTAKILNAGGSAQIWSADGDACWSADGAVSFYFYLLVCVSGC